jgi:nanoRNase/pAp phosphatase (c-di-AMP/oligoRNAs hydrolase)
VLEELREILPSRGRVYIMPHNYPDPDALASAAGMYLLLANQFRLKGQILFSGTVSRAENLELLRQFRFSWHLVNQETPPSQKLPAIFVDTSPWSGNVTVPDYVTPVMVLDHHPERRKKGDRRGMVVDIREGAGATCTMVYQYLVHCGITIPKWLATLMAYAIASETLDLSRDSTDSDLAAYVALLSRANLGNLGRIRHAPLPRGYYGTLQEAMAGARVFGRLAWTHLARVEQPEIVAEVADLLHRLERITWAYCTAMKNERMLISIRSSDPRARCGRLLKDVIGKHGNAGGHHHMAAGYMDMSGLTPRGREARRDALVHKLAMRIERRAARENRDCDERICSQPLVGTQVDPETQEA